jgi:hypothetical protein
VLVAQLSENSVVILEGKVVLTQRERSSAWQARFRVGDKWLRISTKQEELEKAKSAAVDPSTQSTWEANDVE